MNAPPDIRNPRVQGAGLMSVDLGETRPNIDTALALSAQEQLERLDDEFRKQITLARSIRPADAIAVLILDAQRDESTLLSNLDRGDRAYLICVEFRHPTWKPSQPDDIIPLFRYRDKNVAWDDAIRLARWYGVSIYDGSRDAAPVGRSS